MDKLPNEFFFLNLLTLEINCIDQVEYEFGGRSRTNQIF